jgi:hypothetical protein
MLATSSVTLPVVDERQFLTVFRSVLPLHKCADPAAAKPLHYDANSAAEPLYSVADSVADPAATGPAPTETS